MTLLPLLVAAGLSQTAAAGDDGVGIRLKANSDLFNVRSATPVAGGNEGDTTKTTNLGLYSGGQRLEATYVINPNIEAGLILGFGSSKTDQDNSGSIGRRTIGVTGAYNFKLSDGLRGFAQPMVITSRTSFKDDGGEVQGYQNGLMYGLDAGVRIRLIKGATLDPAFEYLMGNSKMFNGDGDQVGGDDTLTKVSSYGLKLGLSVKF